MKRNKRVRVAKKQLEFCATPTTLGGLEVGLGKLRACMRVRVCVYFYIKFARDARVRERLMESGASVLVRLDVCIHVWYSRRLVKL